MCIKRKIQLSQQTISFYKSNKRQPDHDTLNTISEFFSVSTDYILGVTNIRETINSIVDPSDEYVLAGTLKNYMDLRKELKD